MLALAAFAVGSTLAMCLVARRLEGAALDRLLAGWALSGIALASVVAELDGGPTSAWLSVLYVAVVFTSVVLPVVYLAVITVGGALALTVVAIGADRWAESMLVWVVSLGAVAGLAAGALNRSRRSELLWRSTFEAAAVPIAVSDSEGVLVDVNPRFCEWLGYTRDEVLSLPVRELMHPDDVTGHRTQLREIVARSAVQYDVDRRFRTADGRWAWAQVAASRIPTADGEVRLLAQLTDISARKRHEAELEASVADLSTLADVRAALREDRLAIYAQPICSLPDRRVVRHELLVRMIDRAGEVVSPDRFLPAAERYDAIVDIDRWVIGRAVAVARAGKPVNVNISALSLTDAHLLDPVEDAVSRGLEPDSIVFEVTETAMATDVSAAIAFAERAAALGCPIAIDDFGVGFGSLTYIQQLPNVRSLKIDRTFVTHLAERPADRQIVSAVVQLAGSMNHIAVAEGIEDERTLVVAAELGVRFGQGYLFGRPRPVHEIFEPTLAG
jgi:PAS domain S-box-containing protein